MTVLVLHFYSTQNVLCILHFKMYLNHMLLVWDSSVGITIRYGLDGPKIESRWGARFSAPFQTCSGAHKASYTMGAESLSRG